MLRSDDSFFRSLWIPEKHPLALDLKDKPTVDAQGLTESIPFAYNNTGEDPYNFLNSKDYISWMRLLGIKYIFLPGDQRNFVKTTKELNNWHEIVSLVSENTEIKKLDWENDVPAFEIANPYPRFFVVDKIYGVVGKPLNDPNIVSLNYEDGLFDPTSMKSVSPETYTVVFNGGDTMDLEMSLLQKYFQKPSENSKSGWAVYTHDSYLKYKYELLIRNVDFTDLDYSSGIAFSTKKGEQIEFTFKVPEDGQYVFAKRSMHPDRGETSLAWSFEDLSLKKGTYKEVVENDSDFMILNVVALLPKADLDQSKAQSEKLVKNFGGKVQDIKKTPLVYSPLNVDNWTTLKYKFDNPGRKAWIIFSDNYNSQWKLATGNTYFDSYPAYSMINAFYVDPNWKDLEIQFKGQENVRWGIYFTVITAFVLFVIYIFLISKNGKSKRSD